MNIIIERSIYPKIESVLRIVKQNWGFDYGYKAVDDITTESYQQIDFTKDGRPWKLIFPTDGNTAFFIDYTKHQEQIISYAGGAIGDGDRKLDLGDRIAIVVFGYETQEVLELRFVHELLHAIDLPSDSLNEYTSKFLSWWERLLFRLIHRQVNDDSPVWQRRFYKYLLSQRKQGLM